jgi:hypothetical protein
LEFQHFFRDLAWSCTTVEVEAKVRLLDPQKKNNKNGTYIAQCASSLCNKLVYKDLHHHHHELTCINFKTPGDKHIMHKEEIILFFDLCIHLASTNGNVGLVRICDIYRRVDDYLYLIPYYMVTSNCK